MTEVFVEQPLALPGSAKKVISAYEQEVSQKEKLSFFVAFGLQRNHIFKEVSQKEKFSFSGTWLT